MRDQEYVNADAWELDRVLRLGSLGHIQTVVLTGGEPSLQPKKLLQILERVRQYQFSRVRLHTNGYLLDQLVTYHGRRATLWQQLLEGAISDVSLSLADYRSEKNLSIMGLPTYEKLACLLPQMTAGGLSVRLSCYLCDQGIHTPQDVLDYLKFGESKGVKSFIFRRTPQGRKADLQYFATLISSLKEKEWTVSFTLQKNDALVYELRRREELLSLSCTSEYPDPDQKIRRLIYMPDRVVYTSWVDPTSYLFDDDVLSIVAGFQGGQNQGGKYPAARWNYIAPTITNQREDFTIDLHVHSFVSDGLDTPLRLLERAKQARIHTIVFTEHNCLHDDLPSLRLAAEHMGMHIPFCGVELNTVYSKHGKPDLKFHLLVYAQQPDQLAYLDDLYNPNVSTNDHIRKLYEQLIREGILTETWDEIYAVEDESSSTRKKMFTRSALADALVRSHGGTAAEAKERWLPALDSSLRYLNYLDTAKMIQLAHANGCVAVLAHPGWIRPYEMDATRTEQDLFCAIVELAHDGLDGLEVTHRLNGEEMRRKLRRLAHHLGMLTTGGSDYHGKPTCVFGVNGSSQTELQQLLDKLAYLAKLVAL